jgi:hypothetical protein
MTVECLINNPTTEHNLLLMPGDLMFLSILTSKFMNAEFISRLLTFEFIMMLSKYDSALSFSLTVALLAIAAYTSLKWVSISWESIFSMMSAASQGVNESPYGLYVKS